MIEFANALDRLLQLLIIGEQAANLGDPLASHAELPCASTAIADCQNEDPVPFTARTFWAVLGVADGALQQRAAQQLTSDWQLAQELLACSKGSCSKSFTRMNERRPPQSTTNPSELAVFRKSCNSNRKHDVLNFAPESS